MPESRLAAALGDLRQRDVQFIVVGGVAAVLNGAPLQTFDIDLVYSREPANIERLLGFLHDADAIFRAQPERLLRPTASHLAGSGHLNLLTRYGPMDLLATIGSSLDYAELLGRSIEMDIDEGIAVRVLDLETIIAVKELIGSEKDRAVLPVLHETLKMSRKRKPE